MIQSIIIRKQNYSNIKIPYLMSNIDQNHQSFLNKLQHIYSKKGSQTSMSSYTNKQLPLHQFTPFDNYASVNPIKKQHQMLEQKWESVEQELQNIVKPLRDNLTQLILNINDQNKFYKILQLIRKNELLSDIAQTINQKNAKQNYSLKNQIQKLRITVAHLSKIHRQSNSTQKNPENASGPFTQRIDSTRSIPENIYTQARLMKQDQFVQWCDKILIKNKIVITDLKRQLTSKKSLLKTHHSIKSHHNRSFSVICDKDLQNDHPSFYEKHLSLVNKIQQLSPLVQIKLFETIKSQILADIQNLKLQKISCPKFCCSLQNQKLMADLTLTSKNKLFTKSNSRAKDKTSHEVYRNNKTDEYFNRYYKHPSFKMDQIKSVEHTKAEQMNRLEGQYHRMLENRSKLRYGY